MTDTPSQNNILILFAHPKFEESIHNKLLVSRIPESPHITFHNLCERYPDFQIDVDFEKDLLTRNQVIIWQHPLYWYSAPPLLKQWLDMVLELGWAYGPGGTSLQGKIVFNAITTGGPRTSYSKDGYNNFTIKELLAPFHQTANLCKMIYLPPFALHGTRRATRDELLPAAETYRLLLTTIAAGEIPLSDMQSYDYLNDWMEEQRNK
ncbi:MAG: NAD(P)H-dependent oxidoreductase [Bacteroidales bacterium]